MNTPQTGVYALLHRPTQRVYVGSSVNLPERFKKWRMALRTGYNLPPRLACLPRGVDDWDFSVLYDGIGLSIEDLLVQEQKAILRIADKAPERLLNSAAAVRHPPITAFGKTQSIRAWSRELGLAKTTICMRLQAGLIGEEALAEPESEARRRAVAQAQANSLVVIMDGAEVLTCTDAARVLGCRSDTLSKRLRQFRRSDGKQAVVQLSTLRKRNP